MVSGPGWALAALMASRSDIFASAATVSSVVVTVKVAGTALPSSRSSAGRNRRGVRRWRPGPAVGLLTIRDAILLNFFSMTRAFMLCGVRVPSRQAMGRNAARISRARHPVMRRRGRKRVRPKSALFGFAAGHGAAEPGAGEAPGAVGGG